MAEPSEQIEGGLAQSVPGTGYTEFLTEQLLLSQFVHFRAGIRCQLNPSFSFKAQGNFAVSLAAQVHDQPVPMGYGMGIPMNALQGLGIKQSVASAQVE